MIRTASTFIANDNDPRDTRPDGDASGFRSLLRNQELERRVQAIELAQLMDNNAFTSDKTIKKSNKTSSNNNTPLAAALSCTLIATLFAAFCFYSAQGLMLTIVSLTAMVWTALAAVFFSSKEDVKENVDNKRSKKPSIISEVSIVIATVAGLAIWILVSREWGLPLSASDGAAALSALTIIIAALLRSRLSLLASVFAALVWLALYTQSSTIRLFSIWAYPLLALIQVFVSGQSGTKFPSFLALTGAHVWLFWILSERLVAGDISILHAAAISMMIGFAHYRLGKAAGDALWNSAALHVIFGWGLAITGAVGLQSYWLGNGNEVFENIAAHPLGDLSWQVIGAVCIALIGLAGMFRMRHKQMSSVAVLLSLAVALAAAALFDQRDLISRFVEFELNMNAIPLVGLLIGAAIFASAITMCVNGARRKNWFMIIAGLTAIAIQLVLLINPLFWNLETLLVFGMTILASLGFAALFAADAPTDYA